MAAGDWKEMYLAASNGDLELVKYHIKNGSNPNYQHPEILCTPLVASIISGHNDISKFLLAHGADPALLSEFDNLTPIEAAKLYKRNEILKILKELSPRKSWFEKITGVFKRKQVS
ncbi:Ankyrin repeats (3 copies) [compost metagenome]